MALSPLNGIVHGFESVTPDNPIDPLKQIGRDTVEDASVVPAVGTPLDPDSINIHPPNGTPPPPKGQLLEDVKMAEQEEEMLISSDNDVEMGSHEPEKPVVVKEHRSPGINGRSPNLPSPASPPPEPQRESPLHTQASQEVSVVDPDERPSKRPRRMSDAPDLASQPVNGESSSAPPPTNHSTSHLAINPVPIVPMSQTQHRFCLSTVRILKKLKDAAPFLHPVDPKALNIPHYPQIIKHPMDLGTVERKLISSNPTKPDPSVPRPPYLSACEFVSDVKLIFDNCSNFNGPDHTITQMGRRLEAVFDKQIKQLPANEEPSKIGSTSKATPPPPPSPVVKKVPQPRRASTSVPTIRRSESDQQGRPKREIHPPASKDLPYADLPRKARRVKNKRDNGTQEQLKFCSKLLQSLHGKSLYNTACYFYEPVDHVKLDIPSYPKIIKKPMDMQTMRRKLDAGEYSNAQKFYDDFKLMIRNCFTFNSEGTLVNQAGVELQKVFDDKWKGLPPLRDVFSDAEEEEDEESDEDQSRDLVAAMESQIEELNRKMAAIKGKPKEKKKERRKEKPITASASLSKTQANKAYQPGKPAKKAKKTDDSLSFEQKKDLSDTIATLEGQKLERVIQIIHEGVPEIRDSTEEIELDIDSLPHAVLTKLYNFVLRPIRNPPKRSRGVGGGTGGLKRKSMDEDVEAERIRQLEERIALFNGDPAGNQIANPNTAGASAQSSDNSSDESSGSESE